jgi:hypothetical protein
MIEKHCLQLCLEEIENGDFKVRSYSGRGMYGKSCLAIVGDCINPVEIGYLIYEWCESNAEVLHGEVPSLNHISNMHSDSMGLGTVYYWPRIPFYGNVSEELDDEY